MSYNVALTKARGLFLLTSSNQRSAFPLTSSYTSYRNPYSTL